MIRADMISTVGRAYLTSNIENDEYSYPKAYTAASLTFSPTGRGTVPRPDAFMLSQVTIVISFALFVKYRLCRIVLFVFSIFESLDMLKKTIV